MGNFVAPSRMSLYSANVIPPPLSPLAFPLFFRRTSLSSSMARVMSSATCYSFSELPTRCFTMVSKSLRLMNPSRST